MSLDKLPSLVVNNGSDWIKAGLAQESLRCVFPAIVGQHKVNTMRTRAYFTKDKYFGKDAITNRQILRLKYPTERGIIHNWDDMECLWRYMFSDLLSITPEEHSLLITEPPLNPKSNREKMTQIMFETFDFPFLYLTVTPLLALYASGRDLILGKELLTLFPYPKDTYNVIHRHCISRLGIGGRDLTDYLMRIFH